MRKYILSIMAQRSRAGRVALLAFAAGVILHVGHPGNVGPLPVPVFAGLLYAAFATPAAVLTVAIIPAMLEFSDAVQWSRIGVALLTASVPNAMRPTFDHPLVSATLVILLATALITARKRLQRPRALALA